MIDARSEGNGPIPKTLLVASGKGGVGTSIVAALTAIAAAERGDRVLLIDGTESGGTHHHLFGVRPTNSLWTLSDANVHPSDVVLAIDKHLSIIAGGTAGAAIPPATDGVRRTALARVRPSSMRRTTSSSSTRARASTRSRPRAKSAFRRCCSSRRRIVSRWRRTTRSVKSISARRPQRVDFSNCQSPRRSTRRAGV